MGWIRRGRWLAVSAVGAAALLVGLLLFQPWKLFVNEVVDEALPGTTTNSAPPASGPTPAPTTSSPSLTTDPTASGTPAPSPTSTPAPPTPPVELARGTFRSYEHTTTGTARLIRLPDGRVVARLENLNTSNGPDVHVWLSPATVGSDPSGLAAGHLDLGVIKGNQGNANYLLPRGTDPSRYTSVALWCERFSVAFGAATLS